MIETSVTYVSTYTQRNVVRIDERAISMGIATAGSVPKTNSRITSAPAAPIRVSVRTLGPLLEPWDEKMGSRPVRFAVTPDGVACFSAARTAAIGGVLENVACPGG